MRLLSLTVRSYRIHKELTVEFDPSRTLIGWPNESGKSTLVEAAHRVLFLRAKTGGNVQREMVSSLYAGDPEVRLVFEARGRRWEIEKRFAGSIKGSAILKPEGGTPLRDDEAEAKLAELLGVETAGGKGAANQLGRLWSHLWVWQGTAGEQPSKFTAEHKDPLVRHLQRHSATAVLQSATDQRVADRVAELYQELFTNTGRPKASSKPELARLRLEEANVALTKARDEAARLTQAVNDVARAEREIAESSAELPRLRESRTEVETRLQEAQVRRREEDQQQRTVKEATARREELEATERKIRELRTKLNEAAAALQPGEAQLVALAAAEQMARETSEAAEAAWKAAGEALRQSRWRYDLAAAAVTVREKEEARETLATRLKEMTAVQEDRTARRAELAALPTISSQEMTRLRRLEQVAVEAESALRAMAAGIELLEASGDVRLDGAPLAVGETRVLTNEGELSLEHGTRLRIRPGGGRSLAEARHQAAEARQALTAALQRLTLRDLEHAASTLEQRQILEQQIQTLETRWQTLGGGKLADELRVLTEEGTAAHAEWQRRLAFGGESATAEEAVLPQNVALAKERAAGAREALTKAEAAEAAARQQAAWQREKWEKASQALAQHREQVASARQAWRDLETQLRTREETHGLEAERREQIAMARDIEAQATAALQETRKTLAALNPQLLEADLQRLTRALDTQESRLREAENLRLLARDRLASDGSVDPETELRLAQARHREAQAVYEAEERRAKAVSLLHELFTSSREAIDRALMEPLAERISGYLGCLFGSNTTARLRLSDDGIEELELARNGGPAFTFASLSGGAKEQTAAAVRLAVAEILAEEHEGSLPVIFDDAFAYSDADRIRILPRMLDYAAMKGLQIIVLTCAPGDYAGFGAKEIRLS